MKTAKVLFYFQENTGSYSDLESSQGDQQNAKQPTKAEELTHLWMDELFIINQLMAAEHRGNQNAHGADSGFSHVTAQSIQIHILSGYESISEWGERVGVCPPPSPPLQPCTRSHAVTECSLLVEAHYCTEGHCSNICNPRGLNVAERKYHHLIHQTNGSSSSEPRHSLTPLPTLSFHSITHKHTTPHHWELWSQVAEKAACQT